MRSLFSSILANTRVTPSRRRAASSALMGTQQLAAMVGVDKHITK